MLTKADLIHVLTAIEDAAEEFDELMKEKEWYVTSVVDKLTSSKLIITEELKVEHNYTRKPR